MQKERKDFGSFKEDYIKYKTVGIPTCRAIEKRPNSRYAKDHPIGLKAIAFSLKSPPKINLPASNTYIPS